MNIFLVVHPGTCCTLDNTSKIVAIGFWCSANTRSYTPSIYVFVLYTSKRQECTRAPNNDKFGWMSIIEFVKVNQYTTIYHASHTIRYPKVSLRLFLLLLEVFNGKRIGHHYLIDNDGICN